MRLSKGAPPGSSWVVVVVVRGRWVAHTGHSKVALGQGRGASSGTVAQDHELPVFGARLCGRLNDCWLDVGVFGYGALSWASKRGHTATGAALSIDWQIPEKIY